MHRFGQSENAEREICYTQATLHKIWERSVILKILTEEKDKEKEMAFC